MKKELQSMLGVRAYRSQPENLAELVTVVKGETAALEYADAEIYYRTIAPKVRGMFLERVEKATGIAPRVTKTEPVLDDKGEPVKDEKGEPKVIKSYEKDTAYIKHVKAKGTDEKVLTDILQACYDEVGYDITTTRNTGPNKSDREQAAWIIAAILRGESSYATFAAKICAANSGLVLELDADGELSEDDIAGAFKVNRLRTEPASAFA